MQILRFLLRPRTRWAISWLVVLAAAGFVAEQSRRSFNDDKRSDGNSGHAKIDFGAQWLMGRMIVEGKARHLYDRNYLRTVVLQNYPIIVEGPTAKESDADLLMDWLAGTDDPKTVNVVASFLAPLAASNLLDQTLMLASAQTIWTAEWLEHATAPRIGGGLYPPIHAVYCAPLGLLPPQTAYRVVQGVILALVFVLGWLVQRMTEGRVWWPVASLLVMMFPGFPGCIALGQNGLFTLALLLLGWWQLMRGRQALAGLCWGLLAFKPVWAAAFFLVPLLTARWRMAASMAVTGLVQIAVTLPLVGWEAWRHWLQVGQLAAEEYRRQENWIFLSRDLLGIPRRWLLTYEDGLAKDLVWRTGDLSTMTDGLSEKPWDHPLLSVLGWGLWAAVLAITLWVVWRNRQRRQELTGPFPAFVLMGALFACYHFMYYDLIVAALPMLLLFAQPHQYFQARLSALIPPLLFFLMLIAPVIAFLWDSAFHFPPCELFLLLLLWAWCGYHLWKTANHRVTESTERKKKEEMDLSAE
jgi:arabinofuranan 3-O-arabinosyltransferase